ncbi:hypothetical protein BGZ79_008948 [Entomortierella chlamydospora]|nr:hypothetical protein BGZ79_008948 [Entomortierella chlamydospora]
MKLAVAAVFAACTPSLVFALVGVTWSVSNVLSFGLTNVTFRFDIANAPHKAGYYFAQQFRFVGRSDVGYTGLQPRPDSNGQPVVHAVFSSFIAGTTTSDSNCAGNDGSGVSCAVDFSAPYTDGFALEIVKTPDTVATWTGTAVDATTGSRVHIGTWTLPAGTQGITGNQVGFVEYYSWDDGQQHSCDTLPYTEVTFGDPISPGYTGIVGDAYGYGDCVGQVGFQSMRTAKGVQVKVGF